MKRTTLSLSFLLIGALAAHAQPTMVKQFDDWGVYSYQSGGSKSCYVLTIPKAQQPASVDHGSNFFIVGSTKGAGLEPQAIMGYELKAGSRINVTIGDNKFVMFVKDKSAWLAEEAREPAFINAMRSGADLKLEAVSKRGTATSYTYSLSGVTAALKRMSSCD